MSPSTTDAHPSYLELDLLASRFPGAVSPDVVAHVAVCARCRAHADAVSPAEGDEEPLPAWLERRTSERGRTPFSWRRSRMGAAAAALAVAAAAVVFVRARGTSTDSAEVAPYVGEKGTSAVEVLVQRDAGARPWDGRPLHPGDRLGLMVSCAGKRHVTLGSLSGAEISILADAPCHPKAFQLPVSVVLDAEGTEDKLVFAFGDARAGATAIAAELAKAPAARSLEIVNLVLPKEHAR